jgi:SsrA-binding protein
VSEKNVAVNRKAFHDYEVLERVEAGIVLTGTEIKSIRDGRANVREAYARPEGGELWLFHAHIAPYPAAHQFNHDPTRPRKLLLHKQEMRELSRAVDERGLTLVPLRLYLKGGLAKVELGLVRGRRQYDKRQAIARREAERQMARAIRYRG